MNWFEQGALLNAGAPYTAPTSSWFGSGASPIVDAGQPVGGRSDASWFGSSPIANAGPPSVPYAAPWSPIVSAGPSSGPVPYQAPGSGGGNVGQDSTAANPGVSFGEMTGPQAVATQTLNTSPITAIGQNAMNLNLSGVLSGIASLAGLSPTNPVVNFAVNQGLSRAMSALGLGSPTGPLGFLTSILKGINNGFPGFAGQGLTAIASALNGELGQSFGPDGPSQNSFSMPGTSAESLGIQGLSPLSSFSTLGSPTLAALDAFNGLSPAQAYALAQSMVAGLMTGRSGNAGQAGGVGLTGQEGLTSLDPTGQLGPAPAGPRSDPTGDTSGPAGVGNSGIGEAGVGGNTSDSSSPAGVGGEASGSGPAGDSSSGDSGGDSGGDGGGW